MTYWADNIKFIKDIQDSKYKKIEDNIAEVSKKSTFLSVTLRIDLRDLPLVMILTAAQTFCEQ